VPDIKTKAEKISQNRTKVMKDIKNTEITARAGERGMTLLEVMISTVILGVVLVGLGQALTYAIKFNNESKMRIASLNMGKYVTENLKTEISQSQAIFDAAEAGQTTYYVDVHGNKTMKGSGSTLAPAFTEESAFRVTVTIAKGSYTKVIAGAEVNLLRILEVKVVDVQNQNKPGREITMKVEMIRPSTSET
jgi:prepilin-type N-terminal cleavage/methylation domain-containing protein